MQKDQLPSPEWIAEYGMSTFIVALGGPASALFIPQSQWKKERMKIFILKDIKEGAWGGANQFFRLLKKKFEQRDVLALTLHEADVILIDSYQRLQESLRLKKKYPEKKYIFRLGPMFYLHRGWHWKSMDRLVVAVVNACADGIIFQSAWSKEQFIALGIHESIHATVIHNSADRSIFQYKKRNISTHQKEKIHIVSSSWSANKLKGGEHVAYIDQHLGKKFQQIILCGYPPFIKDVIDEAEGYHINWKELKLKLIFAAESFTEQFRDYIVKKCGITNPYIEVLILVLWQ